MSMPAAVPLSANQRNSEPSMEEILASIRKIIAEDQKALDAKGGSIVTAPIEASPAVNDDQVEQPHFEPAPVLRAAPPIALVEPQRQPAPEAVTQFVQQAPAFAPAPVVIPTPAVAPVAVQLPMAPVVEPVAQIVQPAAAAPAIAAPVAAAAEVPAEDATPLMSDDSAYATSAAFHSLTQTFSQTKSRTMDEIVEEMLRPMLSAWLDDNLPALVERLVKAEIERVSRGGR